MVAKVRCKRPRNDANGNPCDCGRYLGEVDGRYHFKCDRRKGVIEGHTKEGWVKIIYPLEK